MHINPDGALITKIASKPEPHLRGQRTLQQPTARTSATVATFPPLAG